MSDANQKHNDTSEFADAAKSIQEADIADETAAYESAVEKDADHKPRASGTGTGDADVTASGAE